MKNLTKIGLFILILLIFIGIISWWATRRNTAIETSTDIHLPKQNQLNSYQNETVSLKFQYSSKFQIIREGVSDTSGWSYESADEGKLVVQLKLKSSVQPKTNLSEATFTVGRTGDSTLIKKCMQKPAGFMLQADSLQKNGQTYYRTKYSDAGAGNYYTVVQYRTVRNNYCYSVEEMVHTTNIHNYPPEREISPFDSAKVWGALDAIWQSFQFTK